MLKATCVFSVRDQKQHFQRFVWNCHINFMCKSVLKALLTISRNVETQQITSGKMAFVSYILRRLKIELHLFVFLYEVANCNTPLPALKKNLHKRWWRKPLSHDCVPLGHRWWARHGFIFKVSLPSSLAVNQLEKMFWGIICTAICYLNSANLSVGPAVKSELFISREAALTGKPSHVQSSAVLRTALAKGQQGCSPGVLSSTASNAAEQSSWRPRPVSSISWCVILL